MQLTKKFPNHKLLPYLINGLLNNFLLALLTDPTITQEELVEIVVCNHIRSVLLFIESIKNKNGFQAKRCENSDIFAKESTKTGDEKCIEPANKMGYLTDKSEEGVFYVKTNGEPPYASKNVLFKQIFFSFEVFVLKQF